MTFEESLDRLKERHEALTQSVELMAHQQAEWWAKTREWEQKNQILLSHLLESVDTLARVAHVHERRITDLEQHSS